MGLATSVHEQIKALCISSSIVVFITSGNMLPEPKQIGLLDALRSSFVPEGRFQARCFYHSLAQSSEKVRELKGNLIIIALCLL